MTNHLGNVLTTVSDRKIPKDDGTYDANGVKLNSTPDNKIDYFTSDITNASDYGVWGDILPQRGKAFDNKYKFGFSGQEKVDEISGSGNHLSFGDYGYDPRTNRRWTLDPKANKLPSWSPYAFGLDNPINVVDEDGQWPKWIHNRIIKMAFKGVLTAQEIKTLQAASLHTDKKPGAQTPENAPEHYMSKPGQDPQEATQESQSFISKKKEEFKANEGEEALFALGEGMHTIMDETSPAHKGSQVWEGTKGIKGLLKGAGHLVKELNLFRKDEDKVKQAAENIKKYYINTIMEKKIEKEVEKEESKGETKGLRK